MTHACDLTSDGLFFRDCIIYVCSTCQPARQNHYHENDYIFFLISQHCNIVQRQKKSSSLPNNSPEQNIETKKPSLAGFTYLDFSTLFPL